MKQSPNHAMQQTHVYEVRPRKDRRGFDLISDALPDSRLPSLRLLNALD
jgi:hypothetical protein